MLVLLAVSAGCAGVFGSGEISEEDLGRSASYNWDAAESDVHVDISNGSYRAIYTLSNRSQLGVYEFDEIGEERPVDIRSVQFRYSNGTVVNASQIEVEKSDGKTVITPPAERGQLAYTAEMTGRNLQLPTYVEDGSYEVVLPEGTRVGNSLLGTVSPRGYETRMVDGSMHVRWDEVTTRSLEVRYYLARDMWLFLGIVALASLVGLSLIGYTWLQIRKLVRRREDLGLNVDVGDDDFGGGGGPPRP